MELKSRKFLISLAAFWLLLVLSLGLWWLFLVVKISRELDRDVMKMAQWEGGTFFVLLILISITLVYFYLQDLKKNRALTSFFSSLTHQLKTPLAAMRLQAEVIRENLGDDGHRDTRLRNLTSRLTEDATVLEGELDKLLQLSHMERGGGTHLEGICFNEFLHNFKEKNRGQVALRIEGKSEGKVWGDEFAFNLILRNLVDNSLQHAHSREIDISLVESPGGESMQMVYCDGGRPYDGEVEQLGTLFFKSSESKGQGIGLYLIKTLMDKMGGKLQITRAPQLIFHLTFEKCPEGGREDGEDHGNF